MKKLNSILMIMLAVISAGNVLSQPVYPIETVLQKGHSRYITCVAFSPNGKFVVTGSVDNTLKLWNTESGKEIRSFSMHTGFIRSVCFSPDGNNILTSSSDNKAIITDIYTGKVVVEIIIDKDRLFKACYSPDGSHVLTMNDRDEIAVWNSHTGKKEGTYKKDYDAQIHSQWFSPDGNKLLTWSGSEESQLTDLTDSLKNRTFHFEKPFSYAISRDGKYVGIGSSLQMAKIFSMETGEELHLLDPDKEKQCDGCKSYIAFSNDSRYFIMAASKVGLTLWDVKKGEMIRSFSLDDSWLDEISFSPDDRYIIASSDDESYIWSVKTGTEVLHIKNEGQECIPVFSPDGNYLLTSNPNSTAALWNLNTGKKTKLFEGYLNKTKDDGLVFSDDNWFHSNIIRYINIKPHISLSPDGKFIAKCKIDSSALLINTETGKVERIFSGHSKVVLCTRFSPDGKWLATAGGDRKIILWDVVTGEKIRTFYGHQELIFDVQFSSDGKYLVSGAWDATFRIWDISSGKMIQYGDLDDVSPLCVAFTPNDLYVVTGELGKKVRIWEFDAGEEFRNIVGHTDIVSSICFSPDGKDMVTASFDGKVKVWDLLSGMIIAKFSGHTSAAYSVAYDPQGKYIASGSNDRTIRIWNPNNGQELHVLSGHSGAVTSIQITKDGKKLISCSIDGEIKVWDMVQFKEIYTYIQIDRNNWMAKNPEGYFDGSSNALKLINYVSGSEVIAVGSLFEKYYTPNLVRRLQQGEEFADNNVNLQEVISKTPLVELDILPATSVADITAVDSVQWFKSSILLSVLVTDQGGGVDELRIYNNGKLVQNESYSEKSTRQGRQFDQTIEVPIFAGENQITAVALNKDRTESIPANLKVYFDGIESDVNLYILSVGINKYKNPSYELSYAIEDAKAYTRQIKKGAESIFQSVEEVFIKDAEADKKSISDAFDEVAKKAGPEDVFIFYFAGHGAMSAGNTTDISDFYIIPFDVTQLYGNDAMLKEKAISTREILELSKKITAQKQLYILDACQSGGALTALNTRGSDREKAIAQLARSTGTFFLLASGAIQYASEAKELGHGIFTYALLEALEGNADGGEMDNKITANELKSYVEDRVPELAKQYLLTPQYPTGYGFGQDFPIVIVR